MADGGSPLPLYRDSPAYRPKVDPLSEEALIHLKSYKYSSVDKSWISYYILRHYVRSSNFSFRYPCLYFSVELLRRTPATVAGPELGDPARLWLHPDQCAVPLHLHPGPRRPRTALGVLQLRLRTLGLLNDGQHRRQTSPANRDIESTGRALRSRH
jgi:hypothetical protein